MLYTVLADLVLVTHFAFVLFAVLGALLVFRWTWIAWLHLPAALWAALIEFGGWVCPLTPLENGLRQRGGAAGYESGFVEHYLLPLLYPGGLTRQVQIVLGLLVLAINVGLYALVLRRITKPVA